MGSLRGISVAIFVVQALLASVALVSAQGSANRSRWQTLSGNAPYVIARGGFSGIFLDSSLAAYRFALLTGPSNVILWCDVQLTKDAAGICFPDLKLDNNSNIADVYKGKQKAYLVNGVPTKGWFAIDYTFKDLSNVILSQGVYSRTNKFDGNAFPIMTVQDTYTQVMPASFWLNIQHDAFYAQHKLSMRNFVLSVTRNVTVDYISSPEVAFLQSIAARFQRSTTKLVFRFLGRNDVEPSTNQTYDSLLKNLTFIKTFASGIIVPKSYIWPVDVNLYLQPSTSVVLDAHKERLEVFASDFYNDVPFSFSYSYDPVAEYLQFVDNGNFSVDGVISDFPITPSAAIDCFAHLGKNASKQASVNLLVISKNGASGDYPGCTDMAYSKAIDDGVDVLDCPVQMTKDGTPICLSSINLIESTTVAQSSFSNLTTTIPEIGRGSGIFTFNLSWSDIQSLTPEISSPQSDYKLFRNPRFRNVGKFLTLSQFLDMAKSASSLYGVLIGIENAPYLLEQGFGVTDAVLNALNKAGYDKQTAQTVMIQSRNSSVLMKFKGKTNYKLVYKVDEDIGGAQSGTIDDIKRFASAVVISKDSVFPENTAFLTGATNVVPRLHAANLSVYVETFSNEFTSQAWDFLSDATVEINTFSALGNINGVITDFPKTSARYRRNRCSRRGSQIPNYMTPVQPGGLWQLITSMYLPPAEAPNPYLNEADVNEPPLPSAATKTPTSSPSATAQAPVPPNGQPKFAAHVIVPLLAVLLALYLLF